MRASIVIQQNRPIASLAQCCANGLTATVAQAETWLENHDELHRRYKENWATWEAACQDVYKMSRQAIHNRILKITDQLSVTSSTTVDEPPNARDKKELYALNQVEQAREEPKAAPKEEEPEKPAVHSADEKPNSNGKAPKPENGKPKTSLVVWREMEETLIGRSLNRADELNRQCPNPQLHAKLIASLKAALQILEQWKDSIK